MMSTYFSVLSIADGGLHDATMSVAVGVLSEAAILFFSRTILPYFLYYYLKKKRRKQLYNNQFTTGQAREKFRPLKLFTAILFVNGKVIINLGTPCWIVGGYTRRHRLVLSSLVTELTLCLLGLGVCNTPGVCHQLSNGFELEHDMLSGDEGVKIKSIRVSSNLNLDNTPLVHGDPC